MKKTISPASRAPATAQPIPMPAAIPLATPELVRPGEGVVVFVGDGVDRVWAFVGLIEELDVV